MLHDWNEKMMMMMMMMMRDQNVHVNVTGLE
jgi:hypothetical protein